MKRDFLHFKPKERHRHTNTSNNNNNINEKKYVLGVYSFLQHLS